MSKDLVVGKLSAGCGEKVTGVNTFAVNGEQYHLPVYLINGAQEGPTLVLTGGVHAAEYASIAAALELGQTLDPKEITGQVLGLVKDVWGNILQTAHASANGDILILVSSLAINNEDPLLSIGA